MGFIKSSITSQFRAPCRTQQPLQTPLVHTLHWERTNLETGNMSSGIDLNTEGLELFEKMRIPGSGKTRYRCVTFRVGDDKKEIVIDKIYKREGESAEDQEAQYNEIVQQLPENDGRYIVWDLRVKSAKGGEDNDRLVFMSWSPDSAPVLKKMVFAASKDAIKKKLKGISHSIDCNDAIDLNYSDVLQKCYK